MTRITNTQYFEHQATRTVFECPEMVAPYTVLLRGAQAEVGRDIGKAIKVGTQWIGNQWTNFWRTLVDLTQPPAAA